MHLVSSEDSLQPMATADGIAKQEGSQDGSEEIHPQMPAFLSVVSPSP